MNNHQIKLVQDSFGLVAKIPAETVGELFYNRLFTIAPQIKPMFGDTAMSEQSRKLISMLAYIVNRLNNLEGIVNEIAKLAQRHVKYGVKPSHYEPVGEALLWTLQQGLGKDWNEDLEEAWTACYNLLSTSMIEACEDTEVLN